MSTVFFLSNLTTFQTKKVNKIRGQGPCKKCVRIFARVNFCIFSGGVLIPKLFWIIKSVELLVSYRQKPHKNQEIVTLAEFYYPKMPPTVPREFFFESLYSLLYVC